MTLTEIEKEVLKVLKQRRAKGRKTYGEGVKLHQNSLEGWINEAIDEAADLLVYLTAAKVKLKKGDRNGAKSNFNKPY